MKQCELKLMDHSSTVYKSQFMDIGALQGFTKTETDLCIGNKSTTLISNETMRTDTRRSKLNIA